MIKIIIDTLELIGTCFVAAAEWVALMAVFINEHNKLDEN